MSELRVHNLDTFGSKHPVEARRELRIAVAYSVRRECLDHMLILGEKHLQRVIKEYVQYYNWTRPHQGISQTIPESAHQRGRGVRGVQQVHLVQQASSGVGGISEGSGEKIISLPVLGGLHHDYRRAA